MAEQRRGERRDDGDIDALAPVAILLSLGWTVIAVVFAWLARTKSWPGTPFSAAVSAEAGWLIAVLCAVEGWNFLETLVHGPSVELLEPAPRPWRVRLLPLLLVGCGVVIGYLAWK